MSKKVTVDLLVEGGKAKPGPQVGAKLGPLKVPIPKILEEINKRTKDFAGMQVPVKIIVDTETKEWKIEIGTPPTSQLIKNELGKDKLPKNKKGQPRAAQQPGREWIGNLTLDQIIKIAKMKKDSLMANSLKAALLEVSGTALSMGVKVENLNPKEFQKRLREGFYDEKLKEVEF